MDPLCIFGALCWAYGLAFCLPLSGQSQRSALDAALLGAAQRGDYHAVHTALAQGANVHAKDSYGNTPLILAALEGHREIVEHLLTRGADIYSERQVVRLSEVKG
jgi:ankyrin repeat protein